MLTKLVIRNFKRFDEVEIPLANPVVFVGPNNSGKTTALQALALWALGLKRWKEKRSERGTPEKRPGVAINRKDLLMVPAPAANLLWRGLHVRNVQIVNGGQQTQNIRIDVLVEGNSPRAGDWNCGLEFDFSNDESFFCRPLRVDDTKNAARMPVPDAAYEVQIAFLPPMSGLASNETRLDPGAINVRLGEGRTAEVLRNLCYQLAVESRDDRWPQLVDRIRALFRVDLDEPEYIPERGEIQMTYRDPDGTRLDLSSSGRGLQQTLLLTAYLALHPGAVLLLDEPDAHLELLRQRDIYQMLTESARANGSQVVIASHSEEVLNQAAGTSPEAVVAFLGKPHRIPPNRATAVRRALDTVRFDQYYLAEQTGWVLYVEDRTDFSILKAFAERLDHPSKDHLRSPFIVPIGNQPNKGREHFNAILEAKPDLQGYLLVDQDAPDLQNRESLVEKKWTRREIGNYICQPETLEAFAREVGRSMAGGPLFEEAGEEKAADSMQKAVRDRVIPAALRNPEDPWWRNVKASDDFLDIIFPEFYSQLGLRPDVRKADYYRLVPHIPTHLIAREIVDVLDSIESVAARARTSS